MKSFRLAQILCPVKETNRTHSKSYVEDLPTKFGQKRCVKMMRLNLSVLPLMYTAKSHKILPRQKKSPVPRPYPLIRRFQIPHIAPTVHHGRSLHEPPQLRPQPRQKFRILR